MRGFHVCVFYYLACLFVGPSVDIFRLLRSCCTHSSAFPGTGLKTCTCCNLSSVRKKQRYTVPAAAALVRRCAQLCWPVVPTSLVFLILPPACPWTFEYSDLVTLDDGGLGTAHSA